MFDVEPPIFLHKIAEPTLNFAKSVATSGKIRDRITISREYTRQAIDD